MGTNLTAVDVPGRALSLGVLNAQRGLDSAVATTRREGSKLAARESQESAGVRLLVRHVLLYYQYKVARRSGHPFPLYEFSIIHLNQHMKTSAEVALKPLR